MLPNAFIGNARKPADAKLAADLALFGAENQMELRESQGLKLRELSKAEKLAEEN
jgi:hypothetical protein